MASVTRFSSYDELPTWLSVEEFQAFWDVSRTAAYELVRSGKVPSTRFGNMIRIPKTALRPPDEGGR